MGIHDRDYWRGSSERSPLAFVFRSAVGTLIAVNVAVWIVQVVGGKLVTEVLVASPEAIAGLRLWTLLTAAFAHSDDGVWHLAWNMLFLYFFGRELEGIYGRRELTVFYLAAAVVSIAAEVAVHWIAGDRGSSVLGASGAVMGVVVLFTLFYPNRQILFMFFIPMPVWALCVLFVLQDLLGLVGGSSNGVANMAHLAGAAVGLVYGLLDLRTLRWGGVFRRWVRRPRATREEARILRMPAAPEPNTLAVSRRIDELLEKISAQGKDSLTEEEWAFLRENSSRYRS